MSTESELKLENDRLRDKLKKYEENLKELDVIISNAEGEMRALNELRTNAEGEFKKQKERFKEQEDKIESLLPGATSAGLASAFFDAKRAYSVSYLESEEEKKERKREKTSGGYQLWTYITLTLNRVWHIAKIILMYGVFIFPLLIVPFSDFIGKSLFDIDWPSTPPLGTDLFTYLLQKLVSGIPWFVISWFGYTSIMTNRKLYEEYNHKQRVMQLYKGFEDYIKDGGTEEQKEKLLDTMLEAVAHRPNIIVSSLPKQIIDKAEDEFKEKIWKRIPSNNPPNPS